MDVILRTRLPVAVSLGLDVLFVIAFVLIGRRSHDHAYAMPDLLLALLPWLIGLAAGWGLIRWRSGAWPDRVPHGLTLAVTTVVLTMILRPLMGQSVGDGFGGLLSFAAVALAFLVLFLLGWRLIAAFILRSRPS